MSVLLVLNACEVKLFSEEIYKLFTFSALSCRTNSSN